MSMSSPRLWRRAGAFTLGLAIACAVTIAALDRFVVGRVDHAAVTRAGEARSAKAVLADEWTDRIQRETTWRSSRRWSPDSNPRNQPSRLQGPQPQPGWFMAPSPSNSWFDEDEMPWTPPRSTGRGGSGYQTVCVRSCDGSFFPVSFGVSESSFSSDQATCSSACPGAKLFYYRSGSQTPEDMVDLSGQKYSKMPNANLFRTQFVASCRCKPNPWDQESVDRHRIYALEDLRKKGDRTVLSELDALKAKYRFEVVASARRRNADRRRAAAEEIVPAQMQQASAAAADLVAPRSDASRGQGGTPLPGVSGSVLAASPAATAGTTTVEEAAAASPVAAKPTPKTAAAPDVSIAPSTPPEPSVAAVSVEPAPVAEPEAQTDPIAEVERPVKTRPGVRRQRTASGETNASRGSRPRSGDWVRGVFHQ